MLRCEPDTTQPAGQKNIYQHPEYSYNVYQKLVSLQETQTKTSLFVQSSKKMFFGDSQDKRFNITT